jgi:hypothetical protein
MQSISGQFRQERRFGREAFLLLFCLSLAGCIGATPMHRKTRGPQGFEQNFTLDSVSVGQTSRAEIQSKLQPFDVGLNSPNFLIARWSVSKWGAWAFACGNTNCAGTAGRIWKRHNLMVEFDEDGRVKTFQRFSDSNLVARLLRVAQVDERLDLSNPIQLHVTWVGHGPATITLSGGSFQFVDEGKTKKPYNFTIAATKIASVGTSSVGPTDEMYVTGVIHFVEPPKVEHRRSGKKLSVQMTIPDLLKLLKFTRAVGNQTSD